MTEYRVTEVIAEAIIRADSETLRFERFTNDVVTEYEGGVPVLPTSRTWDLGRDGRAETSTTRLYVCASLADHVDPKSDHDLRRLAKFAEPPFTVYFCSSQPLSEKKCNDLAIQIRSVLPVGITVTVIGCAQLAHLSERYTNVFIRHYGTELDNFVAAMRASVEAPVDEDDALRLALVGVAHETSDAVRTELYRNAIRDVLRAKELNVAECARDVSHQFRLGRMLPTEVLLPHLRELEAVGDLEKVNDRYVLTPRGVQALASHDTDAKNRLLEGREVIRERIETLIGHALSGDHFDRIWTIIRQQLAAAFYERGQQLVKEVAILLAGKVEGESPRDEPLFFVSALADAVAATSSLQAQQEELQTAIHDLFEEPQGPAFEWLGRLCASYVSLCALGIEAQSGKALARLLAKITIVLDTDITLSLVCEGEPNHHEVQDLVRKWRAIGGDVLVSREVLQEVARHAVIAEYDYQQVSGWIPGTREQRVRVIENAFVRAFAELLARGSIRRQYWQSYIEQYRSVGEEDPVKIAEILAQEYNIHELPSATAAERDLEKKARQMLDSKAASRYSGDRLRIAKDKARRDASLYAAIVHRSRSSRQADPSRACVLVSSARRLAEVEQKLRGVGEPQLVVSLGSAFYLLSLIPGVSLGIGAMQTLLFEVHRRFSGELERVLLRVVRQSEAISLPWARRHRLMREVRNRILADAERAGASRKEAAALLPRLEQEALTESKLPRTVEILGEALNAVVVDQRLLNENLELRSALAALEREAEQQRVSRQRRGEKRDRTSG